MAKNIDNQFYEKHVFICTNKRPDGHERGCCMDSSGGEIRAYMKSRCKELGIEKTRINASGCLDRCELGPVMVIYPEGVWYSTKTTEDAEEIIQQHIISGKIVDRLCI